MIQPGNSQIYSKLNSAANVNPFANNAGQAFNVPKLCNDVPTLYRANPVILRTLRRLTTRNQLIVNFIQKSILTILVAGGCCASVPAFANLLTIVNPSFETPATTTYTYGIAGANPIPGWTISGAGAAGVQNAATYGVTGTPPDGLQFGFMNNQPQNNSLAPSTAVSQTLGDTLQASTTYTLSIDVGGRTDGLNPGTGYSISLYAGSSQIASVTPATPPTGSWMALTASYTSPISVTPGQFLQIDISMPTNAVNQQLDFDNVTLNASPVPEPSVWKIAGALLLVSGAFQGFRLLRNRLVRFQ